MTNRKFYKTVFTVEVLSEESIPSGMDLTDILFETVEGSYSGRELNKKETVLNGKQAAKALIAQESDPGFFHLDDKGNNLE